MTEILNPFELSREGRDDAEAIIEEALISRDDGLELFEEMGWRGKRTIDEVGILFPTFNHALSFVFYAVQLPGVQLFNTARDIVATAPIASTYQVNYWFLQVTEQWRIECVCPADTGSPLHFNLVQRAPNRPMVEHLSVKASDEDDYAVLTSSLLHHGFECHQRCDGGYGRFSFWHHEGHQRTWPNLPLLKPRVNLRDRAGR